MVIDLLAQGFEVPSLSRVRIASAADDLLDDYAAMLEQPVQAPVDVEDIVVNKLGLSWGLPNKSLPSTTLKLKGAGER